MDFWLVDVWHAQPALWPRPISVNLWSAAFQDSMRYICRVFTERAYRKDRDSMLCVHASRSRRRRGASRTLRQNLSSSRSNRSVGRWPTVRNWLATWRWVGGRRWLSRYEIETSRGDDDAAVVSSSMTSPLDCISEATSRDVPPNFSLTYRHHRHSDWCSVPGW